MSCKAKQKYLNLRTIDKCILKSVLYEDEIDYVWNIKGLIEHDNDCGILSADGISICPNKIKWIHDRYYEFSKDFQLLTVDELKEELIKLFNQYKPCDETASNGIWKKHENSDLLLKDVLKKIDKKFEHVKNFH